MKVRKNINSYKRMPTYTSYVYYAREYVLLQGNIHSNFRCFEFQRKMLMKNKTVINPSFFPVAFDVNKLKMLENK